MVDQARITTCGSKSEIQEMNVPPTIFEMNVAPIIAKLNEVITVMKNFDI